MAVISRVNTVITSGLAGSPWFSSIWFRDFETAATKASDAVRAMWAAMVVQIGPGVNFQVQPDIAGVESTTGEIVQMASKTQTVVTSTGTGDFLPPATQCLVRLRTGVWVSGRQVVGHMYIPGMLEANNTATGQPSTTLTGVVEAAVKAMTTTAGNPTQVVYSRKYKQALDVPASTPGAVICSTKWAVLRSRRD